MLPTTDSSVAIDVRPLPSASGTGTFRVRDLGLLPYADALKIQNETFVRLLAGEASDTLLLVEHPPVLTLGAGFHEENLLFPVEGYRARGIAVERADRGGDVTYHGPGQLVIYPIFDIAERGKDLHKWLRQLEAIIIDALASVGVEARRQSVNSGVWVETDKICAIGIKMRRWVSTHGLALNCDLDLAPFEMIVPCGIGGDYGVTSVSRVLGRKVSVDEMKEAVVASFEKHLGPLSA